MGNSVGVELKPPSLTEVLGETDEPEKSPPAGGSLAAEPTFRSVLRGWKFSTSSNGLLGSTSPVKWLEIKEFSQDSCYLVVHAFVRDGEKVSRKRKASKGDGECDSEENSEAGAGEQRMGRKHSDYAGGEIKADGDQPHSARSMELREAASAKLTRLLESTQRLTPRGQQTVFGGYHAPGYNRRKMTAITFDIYVLRGTDATAISKSTATAKAVEIERLLSDPSAQRAVRRLCFVSDESLVAPLVKCGNLYSLESMEMELWSQAVARNHLFATITRYSSAQQTAVKKKIRSGSLPASDHITTTRVDSPPQSPVARSEPEKARAPEPAVEKQSEKTKSAGKTSPSRSKRKSRSSRKKSREKVKDMKKKKEDSRGSPGKMMLDHHFRSVSLPASEMKKLKSNAMGSTNVPAIKIPLGMTSLEQPVQEDVDDKPMGGASMAKKFDHICSQITDSLFLGSDTVARDSRELRRNKITHILNCAGGYCGNYHPQLFKYMTLHLLDGKSENIACLFYEVLEFIDDAISNGGKVFVHCQQGVSRSSAMLILYLMWKMHKPFNETHEYVKNLRHASSPNAGFISQLMEWWKRHTKPLSTPELYQVVPHCPVAPDTIVFKRIASVSPSSLDKRGCFVLRDAGAIYVWAGKSCPDALKEWGLRYAARLKKYENDPSKVVVEVAGEESQEFQFLMGGPLAKVGMRTEYDASYQLLKLASRGSMEKLTAELPEPANRRKSTLASSSSAVAQPKRKRKSRRKMGDRVASTSKIGRFKVSDS
mmetsp:Transcript_11189/g.45534  ORF Transcript_11189/g.45534 Transcript_11189/m.45534 type:complete len:767 (-) Transcript_11189:1388-3688(-)